MLDDVAKITLEFLVDAYLRRQERRLGQTGLGKAIGVERQGVNAILNKKPGRRFTFDHLDRYAHNTGIPISSLCKELALLAWELEGEALAKIPTEGAAPVGAEGQPRSSATDLLTILKRLLEEAEKQRP